MAGKENGNNYERLAVGWFSKNKKAFVIGLLGENGQIVDETRMFLFTDNFDSLRDGKFRWKSVPIYKSQPLPPRE